MSWLAIALWGGVVGMDGTSFPQVMISRPLVAAAVTGALLGRPVDGLVVGALLELFALVILPIGAARYPETGTAGVGAAAAYSGLAGTEPGPAALLVAIVFALVWERVAGASVNALRRLNERLVASGEERASLTPARVDRIHVTAMALDFARGAAIALVGGVLAVGLIRSVATWSVLEASTILGILVVAGAGMAGAALSLFDGWSERRLAVGIGIGFGLVLLFTR